MRNTPHSELIAFIKRIPSVKVNVSSGFYDERFWWIKFAVFYQVSPALRCRMDFISYLINIECVATE